MSLAGLVASFIIVLAFVLYVVLPLLRRPQSETNAHDAVQRQRDRLTVYYERVLRNLHDLDEDYATGKLIQSEYQQEREAWVDRGVQALKALDELDSEHLMAPATADDITIDEAIDDAIENAVQQHSQASSA